MMISMVTRPISTWNSSQIREPISGVATLKVVAVPASRANTASRSMIRPGQPSVCLPRMGRQASEYFCRFCLRTWSMNPKATASTK